MTNSEFNPGFLGIVILLLRRNKRDNAGTNMAPALRFEP
jgi:hypothetical protein